MPIGISRSQISVQAKSTAWNNLQNATGALTLANGGNATTFNQTSAVAWTWANTTVATSSAASPSPAINLSGKLFNSGVDTVANLSLQNSFTASPNNKTITNSVETSLSIVTLTVGASHGFTQGQWVTLTGLTAATWLNNQNSRITSVAATTITLLDSTSHGTKVTGADNGTVTLIPNQEMTLTGTGSAGNSRFVFPVNGVANANDGSGGFAFTGMPLNTGFGQAQVNFGGFAIHTTVAGASSNWLACYNASTVASQAVPSQLVASIEFGDSSQGNATCQLKAGSSNGLALSVGMQGNLSSQAAANPCVVIGNANALTAVSGAMVGIGMGYGKGVSNTLNFAPTSGTATFNAGILRYTVNQTGGANGNTTGLLVNAVETAVGGTHILFELQAGTTGGTREFAINNTGVVVNYAATALVGQGIASQTVNVDLTGQGAAIAATNLIASAPRTGMYRISWSATITTAATTGAATSVLGGTNGFQIGFTSPTDSVAKTVVPGNSVTSAANTTATAVAGSYVVYAKTGTAITYAFDYASNTAGEMKYELHIRMEAM